MYRACVDVGWRVIVYLPPLVGVALTTYFMWRAGRGPGDQHQPPAMAYVVLGSLFAFVSLLLLVDAGWLPHVREKVGEDVWNAMIWNEIRYLKESVFAQQRSGDLERYAEEVRETRPAAPAPTDILRSPLPERTSSPVVPSGHRPAAIVITSPIGDQNVPARVVVMGTVSDPRSAVWVVVHPLLVSGYWVQPNVSVEPSGEWKTMAYIGRAGNLDVGQSFEIRAVVNPGTALHEGLVLPSWPDAEALSDVMEVQRE